MSTKSNIAVLKYAQVPPTDEQLSRILEYLRKESSDECIEIRSEKDESIQSGFIITYGNLCYDWSTVGRERRLLKALRRGYENEECYLSSIQKSVEDFELDANPDEIGKIRFIGDGIAYINGIDHAFYGEVLVFEDGSKGMVQDIREGETGCILFSDGEGLKQSSQVRRTGHQAGIKVGSSFIGRVIDSLGNPIDGLGKIDSHTYMLIESPSAGIIDRSPVCEPLETGILSIDAMFPIGKGQRELIIGDRQTGKTSIAADTISNQKGKNVICIYVAVGQKASTIARLVKQFKDTGAMDYTIVVASTASDPASLQYIAPYSGTALAEYFMYQGKDVLIVYDDLSRHAVAYRSLSLLMERPSGREAYPGDVFYLHSRLLERSARLSDDLGGGSITALPIIETLAGDVSAYIPTNVISITDGQIFLDSDLFFEGMRPAVNVGLSVSRVGGAAQTKAIKKSAGSLRIDLAQYREMAVFTQFSSDLDETTLKQLKHGEAMMELLKQPITKSLSSHAQVLTLVLAGAGLFDDVDKKKVKALQQFFIDSFERHAAEMINQINHTGDLDKSLKKEMIETARKFKEEFEKAV